MGLTILSGAAARKSDNAAAASQLQRQGSGGDSGSDREDKVRNKVNSESALQHWYTVVAKDRKEKLADPEYRPEAYVIDFLYWMVKVKSEFHWQLPLIDCIKT